MLFVALNPTMLILQPTLGGKQSKKFHLSIIVTLLKQAPSTELLPSPNRGYPLEITTFRSETEYEDHRHPRAVTFVSSITEDLARRDFTINAMAFHPVRGLIDPYEGQADLHP